jgi:DNA modification methylase
MEVNSIIQGDTLEVLKTFPDDCIDTIITSPPYWGLRDYGEETNIIWDGDKGCEHEWEIHNTGAEGYTGRKRWQHGETRETNPEGWSTEIQSSAFCPKCGAWYGQLGLEPTLELYLSHLLQITAELKRVLKPSGIMFWNHGDCYGSHRDWGWSDIPLKRQLANGGKQQGIKGYEKCMMMQNYRLILKMIDEQGWILRNTLIWNKPNHMPSSVRDRFASSYEPIFMLVKNKKYWFDLDAVRIPLNPDSWRESKRGKNNPKGGDRQGLDNWIQNPTGKNPGDVWTIPTQPFPEAHFAVYPEKLVEPMVKAGCPEWICKKCGKPREKIKKTEYIQNRPSAGNDRRTKGEDKFSIANKTGGFRGNNLLAFRETIGWTDCGCNAGFEPGIILDPFAGAGTTCMVAKKLGRYYVGIELNPEYCKMAEKRSSEVVRQGELSLC